MRPGSNSERDGASAVPVDALSEESVQRTVAVLGTVTGQSTALVQRTAVHGSSWIDGATFSGSGPLPAGVRAPPSRQAASERSRRA